MSLHCIHFCKDLLRLYSLLYWTSYTAAFNSVQSCYTTSMLCIEFLTECFTLLHLLLQRTSSTVCMHVQNSTHYIHFSKRITWLYSSTCRMFYNAITPVQNTLQLQLYMDAYKSNASRNSFEWHVQRTQFCSQHLWCRLRTRHMTCRWGIPCRQHNSPCLEYRLTTWARVCIFIIWTKTWPTGFQVILHLPLTSTRTLQAAIIINVDVIPWPVWTTCLKKKRNHVHKYLPNSIQSLLDWIYKS